MESIQIYNLNSEFRSGEWH